MRTTFSGIAIALRALQAQQISLDITGHNVANANNPNYSRQTAIHSATKPYPTPMMGYTPSNGQLGTGVEVSQINRMRDSFVDLRLRQQLHSKNYWATMEEGLRQVELFFNEPTENAIHYALDQFWDSLQDLSREPDFVAVREVVVQRAQVLVEAITSTRGQLQKLRANLNDNIRIKVEEINSLARRIADLNVQIGKISATGSLPNDLLDARDALLEELSQLVDIEVTQDHANMVGVTIGGASLVHRATAYTITTAAEPSPQEGYEKYKVIWAATGSEVDITSGAVGGMQSLRDHEIQEIISALDDWTREFASKVNEVHNQGYDLKGNGPTTDFDFFTFKDDNLDFAALNIEVNRELTGYVDASGDWVAADMELIRASLVEGVRGNGDNALMLARLRTERFTASDNREINIGDEFNRMVSEIGVSSQRAIRMVENQTTLENHLRNLKESTSGVSLDEEMANMIRFQHAYSAAARMMTVVDQTLDVIINRLGVVGR